MYRVEYIVLYYYMIQLIDSPDDLFTVLKLLYTIYIVASRRVFMGRVAVDQRTDKEYCGVR
jgi:hypothetical protein